MPNEKEGLNIRELGAAVREVTSCMTEVFRSEVQLAKAEVKDAGGKVGRHATQIGIFALIGALGALPFLGFCVIGLGILFGGNYWLSSLIVSLVLFLMGGGLAFRAYNRLQQDPLSLPETRNSLNEDSEILQRKIHQISEINKRRSA